MRRGAVCPMTAVKNAKKLWLSIGILVLLSPLGVIIPALFGARGAWGEWSLEEVRRLVGYVPAGMEKIGGIWRSPMPNYTVPGQGTGIAHLSLGYLAAAVIGAGAAAGLAYLIAKLIGRRN